MLSKLKKALKDLATAHFTKNMLRVRNVQIFIFFLKKTLCFCINDIYLINQEIMYKVLFGFPIWNTKICLISRLFDNASMVDKTGLKMIFLAGVSL